MAVNIKTTVLFAGALCSLKDWYCFRQTCCLLFQVFRPKDKCNMFYGNICTLLPGKHHIPKDCHCDLRESKHARETVSDYDLGQGKDKPVPLFIQ